LDWSTNRSGNRNGDIDSTPDGDDTNDADGDPNSPADNTTGGDGTGTPGGGDPATDEDDHDPALIDVEQDSMGCEIIPEISADPEYRIDVWKHGFLRTLSCYWR